jgi:hypothetical protein
LYVFSDPKWINPWVGVSGTFKLPQGNGISRLAFWEINGGRYYQAGLANDPNHIDISSCGGPFLYSNYAVRLPNDNAFTIRLEYGVWHTYNPVGGISSCSQSSVECRSGPVTVRTWGSISLDITNCT